MLTEQLQLPEFSEFVATLAKRVRLLAEENPDTVYPKQEGHKTLCLYTKGLPNGGCIIGQAIKAEYALLYAELEEYEKNEFPAEIHGTDVGSIVRFVYGDEYDHKNKSMIFLKDAQSIQDADHAWKYCI